jgi:hypothetical protein
MRRLFKKQKFGIFAAFALVFFVSGVTAGKADVVWTVQGTFSDGTKLTGTFTTNVYGFIEDGYSLTTQAYGKFAGFTYTSSNSYFNNGTFFVDFQPGWHQDLSLAFLDNLGVPNANNPMVGGAPGPSFECQDSFTCYLAGGGPDQTGGGPVRYLDSGFASAVPEPATWAMMLLGFLGIGFVGYRRSSRRTAGSAGLRWV